MTTLNNPTDKKYKDWEELKKSNPWKEIFDYEEEVLLQRVLNEKEFIYSKDKDVEIIDEYNKKVLSKGKDSVFVTSLLPKPYRGNLKDPKLVILSLNPGYNERVKKTMFKMLKPECQLRFIELAKKNALLEDDCCIISDDVDVVTDNGYWLDKLSGLISEQGVDASKIGLIQFVPYASEHFDFNSWPKNAELETQKFSVEIIRRLLYKDESTLFLVMRAKKRWEELFKKHIIEIDKQRFLYNDNPICQKISPDNLKEQYKEIVKAFNK